MRRFLGFLVGLIAIFGMTVAAVPAAPANAALCSVGQEWELLGLVNQFRASNGRGALTLSAELMVKAQKWSDLLAAENGLRHSNLTDAVSAGWAGIAENVAYNYSVAANQAALEKSPGHRTNLLGNYSELGLGVSCGAGGRIFVSQVFVIRATPTLAYQAVAATSTFVAVPGTRLLDTRGGAQPAPASRLTAGVAGVAGVPGSGVNAAVVVVSAVDGANSGWLQVGPAGQMKAGAASNVNWSAGTPTASTTAIVPLGNWGAIEVFIAERAHVVIDLIGYYKATTGPSSAGRTVTINPVRALDTRSGYRPWAGAATTVDVHGLGGIPGSGVKAVIANVTAVGTDGAGSVIVAPGTGTYGGVELARSARGGQTVANLVIIPVDSDGRLTLTPAVGTHLLLDLFAWITDETHPASSSGMFVALNPIRFLDTRNAIGVGGTRPVNGNLRVDVSSRNFYPACTQAVFGTVTSVAPTQSIWMQVGPQGRFANGAFSNVNNDAPGGIVANAAVIPVGDGCDINIFSSGPTHEIVDLAGYFTR